MAHVVEDPEGARLRAEWSRSGARLIVGLATADYHPIAQVLLTREQVADLARFIDADPDEEETAIRDAEGEAELHLAWTPSRSRLVVTAAPRRRRAHEAPAPADPREDGMVVRLRPEQAEAFVRFLEA